MAYSLTLKRPRNKGLNFKTTNRVEIDDGRVDSKAKATAQHHYEKYMTMARESMAIGDRIAAESCYQHAEHYLRLRHEAEIEELSCLQTGPSVPPDDARSLNEERL